MFSKIDKAITGGITTATGYLVGAGVLTGDEATSLAAILTTIAAAAIGGVLTYLFPNRA